jgi:hypothetical protein
MILAGRNKGRPNRAVPASRFGARLQSLTSGDVETSARYQNAISGPIVGPVGPVPSDCILAQSNCQKRQSQLGALCHRARKIGPVGPTPKRYALNILCRTRENLAHAGRYIAMISRPGRPPGTWGPALGVGELRQGQVGQGQVGQIFAPNYFIAIVLQACENTYGNESAF